MSCVVEGCKNYARMAEKPMEISFHQFPKELNYCYRWLDALGIQEKSRDKWTWSRNKKVCSKHFSRTDFIQAGEKRMLKPEALPCLMLQTSGLSSDSKPSEGQIDSNIDATASFVVVSGASSSSDSFKDNKMDVQVRVECTDDLSVDEPQKINEVVIISKEDIIKVESVDDIESSTSRGREGPIVAQQQPTDTTKDSRGKRRIVQVIREIHSYSASPSTFKKRSEMSARGQGIYRKKLYAMTYRNKKLKEKVAYLQSVINALRNEKLRLGNATQP